MQRALTFLALFGIVVAGFGQGRIAFNNTSSLPITTNSFVGGPSTAPISGPIGSYYFALFMAAPGTTDPSLFSFTGDYRTNNLSGGTFGLGAGAVTLSVGSEQSFIVRGWSGNIGPNYSDVTAYLLNPTFDAWYGESQIATVTPTVGDFPPTPIFGTFPGRIPGFNLNMVSAVPEPSAVVLGILGGAALFFFRRRARH